VSRPEQLLGAGVTGFLDDLYDSDPVSHRLVNQAILAWNATARPRAGRSSKR